MKLGGDVQGAASASSFSAAASRSEVRAECPLSHAMRSRVLTMLNDGKNTFLVFKYINEMAKKGYHTTSEKFWILTISDVTQQIWSNCQNKCRLSIYKHYVQHGRTSVYGPQLCHMRGHLSHYWGHVNNETECLDNVSCLTLDLSLPFYSSHSCLWSPFLFFVMFVLNTVHTSSVTYHRLNLALEVKGWTH